MAKDYSTEYAVIMDDLVWDKFATRSEAQAEFYKQRLALKEERNKKRAEITAINEAIDSLTIKEMV